MVNVMPNSLRLFMRPWRTALAAGLVAGSVLLAAAAPARAASQFWDTVFTGLGYASVDPDRALAAQPGLIESAVAGLAPQRPGVADLYFIGLAGDGRESVFRREVDSVTRLFDARFGTKGRSVRLINSPRTIATVPLATPDNLRTMLARVGQVMDKDEDVLFLFMTSHGGEGNFWIDAGPVPADQLYSDDLKDMLDESGIKWRVLVISACHSGSFIGPVWDAHTLIITAARYDRSSFGCTSERDWTYFGEAYFDRALRSEPSFVAAFDQAEQAIARREKAEDLRPSYPQMRIGRLIGPKLAELEGMIRGLQQAESPAVP
jgi:peptidase C13-like protein